MERMLRAVAAGQEIEMPVAVVAAHPDDETLGLGGRLSRFRKLTLIHLTEGAPSGAWQRAAMRRAELRRALRCLGAQHARKIAYGYPDQGLLGHLGKLVEQLTRDLAGVAAVFTHAYEHGHPDHDTAALAVALACAMLAEQGHRVVCHEFPSYHLSDQGPVYGAFWPDAGRPAVLVPLGPGDCARKQAAIRCFLSQSQMTARYPLGREELRQAPSHDFRWPAPPGAALYDQWGWAMTSAAWRATAATLLTEFEERRLCA